MKERPILYTTAMVAPVLDGTKTQTRREVSIPASISYNITQDWRGVWMGHDKWGDKYDIECRYGEAGDRLWVREPYYQRGRWLEVAGEKTRKTGRQKWCFIPEGTPVFERPEGEVRKGRHHKDPYTTAWHQRLARFMPRQYSRITLEIVSVRVERLHDISEADCWAEGIGDQQRPLQSFANLCIQFPNTDLHTLSAGDRTLFAFGKDSKLPDYGKVIYTTGRGCYAYLWESINGPGSWAKNPFVWVIQFRRVK